MQIRILGAHQSNSASTRSTTILVDGVLSIDAGSLASTLTLEEQDNVQAILLTHQHYDHLKDIPALGLNTIWNGPTNVYCIRETKEAILTHLLNDVLWPDLTKMPSVDNPALAFFSVEPLKPFEVAGYEVLAVPVSHAVPTVGYQVERNNRRLFYTADMGGGGAKVWPHINPDLLITEVTYPNRCRNVARDAQHLTAALLHGELEKYRSIKGQLPRIVVIHVSAHFDHEIREEVAEIAARLGVEITVAQENMSLEV